MERVYISGKISDLLLCEVKTKFGKSERVIRSWYGIQKSRSIPRIINPVNIKPLLRIKCWLFYMIPDLAALYKCDAICFQSDWQDSKGACTERAFALWWNKTILLQEDLEKDLQASLNELTKQAMERELHRNFIK